MIRDLKNKENLEKDRSSELDLVTHFASLRAELAAREAELLKKNDSYYKRQRAIAEE